MGSVQPLPVSFVAHWYTRTDSIGEATDSIGEATDSIGEATDSIGEATDSTGEATDSTGEATDSTGEATDSTGEAMGSESEGVHPESEGDVNNHISFLLWRIVLYFPSAFTMTFLMENTMASRVIVSFDWAIKNILRDKANYDVLEGFLLALLKEKITITELIESESNQDNREMKFNRVDVLAINSKGEHIIIEVQYSPEQSYFKRLLYGTSKDIVDNAKISTDYGTVKKVYSVSLIYFDVEANGGEKTDRDYVYHGRVEFIGLHNGKKVEINPTYLVGYDSKKKEDIDIFPEYFIIPLEVFNDAVNDDLDEWIYAFKNHEVKDEFKSVGIKQLGKKLDFVSMDPEKQKSYKKYQEDLASDRGVLELNSLKAEKRKALEIAQNLKYLETPLEIIAKVTGLSLDDLEELI